MSKFPSAIISFMHVTKFLSVKVPTVSISVKISCKNLTVSHGIIHSSYILGVLQMKNFLLVKSVWGGGEAV